MENAQEELKMTRNCNQQVWERCQVANPGLEIEVRL